jgi:predicted  nucleic acid-binding Zn-ribbon protein
MISVKQIQKLEEKIFKTVELIKALKEENKILKSEIESANKKNEELEQIISDYRSTQVEIEEGIENAIKQLDDLDKISAANTIASNNTNKEEKEIGFFQDNSASVSDKEENSDEEVEEIKINYSKLSQNKPAAPNTAEKKVSPKSETEKDDSTQVPLF